ncbi:thiamine phosphate synthase [Paenibacillus sp. 1001270B_150601_E10]|uniref:thiamine phosphate synthase n=1 Tax=Paenibacillus sp. 1001270B_150601_E10 TaxID=2787079 RepID=UPI00189D7BAC|nr:thiamine phosphate synthase [Paenibacillus sp. 1001270B_150601_E10]
MIPRLHAITPEGLSAARILNIASSIVDTVDVLHLRQKKWTAAQMWELLTDGEKRGIPAQKWIINDRTDIAHSLKALGSQLTYSSLPTGVIRSAYPNQLIGVSIHHPDEAVQHEEAGAHYLLYGHVFETQSKLGVPARGIDGLRDCKKRLRHAPIIAIGGIEPAHVPSLFAAGAYGVAVMSSIWLVSNPLDAALRYQESIQSVLIQQCSTSPLHI